MRILTLGCMVLMATSVWAQESIIKDFAEPRKDLKYCLYPSTLRMLNTQKDPAFNELVSDIDKLLIYKLDSSTTASKNYLDWTQTCEKKGFENYITMSGAMNLQLYGKKKEYVGFSGSETQVIAFYLKGDVGLQKIPTLIRTFERGDVLNMLTDRFDE